MSAPENTLRFAGPVTWVAGPGRGGITLLGQLLESDGTVTPAQLSLVCPQLQPLPEVLNDLTFEALPAQQMVLRSGTRSWQAPCVTWQLHRDAGCAFYAAIRPRRAPWTRRLAWRALLGIAATAPGQWLLARRKSQI
jgi:hypothetical protein